MSVDAESIVTNVRDVLLDIAKGMNFNPVRDIDYALKYKSDSKGRSLEFRIDYVFKHEKAKERYKCVDYTTKVSDTKVRIMASHHIVKDRFLIKLHVESKISESGLDENILNAIKRDWKAVLTLLAV